MRARFLFPCALAWSASSSACASESFDTAPTGDDSATIADGATDARLGDGSDGGGDGDATLGDAVDRDAPLDGSPDSARPDSTTPTCTGTDRFVHSSYTFGGAPAAIAVGDVDGDGNLDLAIANSGVTGPSGIAGPGTVHLLLGRGDGTFALLAPITIGPSPSGVALGDFNGDKIMDIATTSSTGNQVGVLLAVGTGGRFGPMISFTVGGSPSAIAAGKLNSDERVDLVVTCAADATINTLIAAVKSTIGFDIKSYPVGLVPSDVVITDWNTDRILDLLVINSGGDTVTPLSGGPDGNFSPSPTFGALTLQSPRHAVMGDFNTDGRLDLAVASHGGPSVVIFPALGTGSFGPGIAHVVPFAEPVSIAAADFNGDGHLDLVAGSADDLALLDVGSLTPSTTMVAVPAAALVTGDFNGDGKPDIAATNPVANSVTILLGCR